MTFGTGISKLKFLISQCLIRMAVSHKCPTAALLLRQPRSLYKEMKFKLSIYENKELHTGFDIIDVRSFPCIDKRSKKGNLHTTLLSSG
jgi:hypothetical protein